MKKLWCVQYVVLTGHNYLYAYVPEHPKATKDGYVYHHRIVMENKLGRLLRDDEVVHHKNKNGRDNKPRNLEVKGKSEHAREHGLEKERAVVELRCPECTKIFERSRRQTHLVKPATYTCCSPSCRGRFSRRIQLQGWSDASKEALKLNVVREYKRPRSLADQALLS